MRRIVRRIKTSPYVHYEIDTDFLKSIPMPALLNTLGYETRGKQLFCPDPNCSDHHSKNPAAILGRNNKVHCFTCGETFSTIDIAALYTIGSKELDSAEFLKACRFLGEELGYGGVTKHIYTQEEKEKLPPAIPAIQNKDLNPVPLYKLIGLSVNPFTEAVPASVTTQNQLRKALAFDTSLTKEEQSHVLSLLSKCTISGLSNVEGANLFYTKGLEFLESVAYDMDEWQDPDMYVYVSNIENALVPYMQKLLDFLDRRGAVSMVKDLKAQTCRTYLLSTSPHFDSIMEPLVESELALQAEQEAEQESELER